MGKQEFASPYSVASNENLRAWVSAHLAAFDACGLARASDTGQIDPATVILPTASGGTAGYSIHYLNDSLHSTYPLYIKIEYGFNSGSTTSPAMRLSVGRGSNGSGLLSGVIFPSTSVGTRSLAGSSTPYTHLASSGDGWFSYVSAVDHPAGNYYRNHSFIVERSRSFDGTPSGDAIMLLLGNGDFYSGRSGIASLPQVFAINYQSGAYTMGCPPVIVPYSVNGVTMGDGTSLAAGSIGPVYPWVLVAPGVPPWQSNVAVSIPAGDVPGSTFTTTLSGKSMKFRPVPLTDTHRYGVAIGTASNSSGQGNSMVAGAFRWED